MYYHMLYEAFHDLQRIVKLYLPCTHVGGFARREAIKADLTLAVVLWRLGHDRSLKTIFGLFGIGDATIKKYVAIIVGILCEPRMLVSI